MGIYVRDLLKSEAFKDFELLAGHGGLDNQIQGLAVMDAPDGFQWTHGRELLITSGYVFYKNPGLIDEIIASGDLKGISAAGVKLGRFFNTVPDYVLAAFDEFKIPLIRIPYEYSWMAIMNQLNVFVMNRTIQQFNIRNFNPNYYSDLSYQVRKIGKILSHIEKEMKFPAMLYDRSNDKAYYSSPEFLKLADHLHIEDFWQPSFEHQQEVLCNNLGMIRYRIFEQKYEKPFSWITVPITVGDEIEAYFVVVEATGLIDYFDQFALRIGFVLLQSLYEQMLIARNIGDTGFEKFITDSLFGHLTDYGEIAKRVTELEMDPQQNYYFILMKQMNPYVPLSHYKDIVKNIAYTSSQQQEIRLAVLQENQIFFLFPEDKILSPEKNIESLHKFLHKLMAALEKKVKGIDLQFGISDISDNVFELKRNYSRCEKTIANGKLLFPDKKCLTYSELGAFAWMGIQEDEIEVMLKDLKKLYEDEENKELIETLKVYLDCKMNYSHTAKKLYLHINTVRKRIEQINDKVQIDLEDPLNRLKLEILLNLFQHTD